MNILKIIILRWPNFGLFLERIYVRLYYLHWALYQEYLNIQILNNLIVLTELFPTPDLLDWRIPIYIYIYKLYGHLPSITKTLQLRRTRHAGHCWRSRDEVRSDVLLWTPTYCQAKLDDQLEHTFSSYVRIRDVALKTCQRRWTIGRSGERGSWISVLVARHDDDDDDDDISVI